jgi:hypothetical protein
MNFLVLLFVEVATSIACNGYEINRLLLPGTHNSYSVADKTIDTATPGPAVNQDPGWTIEQQLADGIRYFEIDIWNSPNEPDFHVCHSVCSSTFYDAGRLADIMDKYAIFLQNNPNEVVIIIFQNGAKATVEQLRMPLQNVIPYVYVPNGFLSTWPTLKTLIATNKRLIIFTDVNPGDFILDAAQYIQMTQYKIFKTSQFNCSSIDGQPFSKPFFRVNHQMSREITNSVYYPDYLSRNTVNSEASLTLHINQCKDHFISTLMVDWGRSGDLLKIVRDYNTAHNWTGTTTNPDGTTENKPSSDLPITGSSNYAGHLMPYLVTLLPLLGLIL